MKALPGLLAFAVAVAISACSTAPTPRLDLVTEFPIEQPFDAVWSAVVETFADLRIPIVNIEKDSGLIVSDWIGFIDINIPPAEGEPEKQDRWKRWQGGVPSKRAAQVSKVSYLYADCGDPGLAQAGARYVRFNVFLRKLKTGVLLKVNTSFQETRTEPLITGSRFTADCVSTGYLEARIHSLVTEKLRDYTIDN